MLLEKYVSNVKRLLCRHEMPLAIRRKEELTHETERVAINDQKHSTLISKQTQTDEIERE